MGKEPTEKQKNMLAFLEDYAKRMGYPPTVSEIQRHFKFASPNAVTTHLKALLRKGLIRQSPGNTARSYVTNTVDTPNGEMVRVPLLGDVQAGKPIIAPETVEDTLIFPKFIAREDGVFLMRVKGDSMIKIGINEGDYILVKPASDASDGQVVVASVYDDNTSSDEVTVKRFFRERDRIRLVAENDDYEPIYAESVHIYGKVIGVIRLDVN